MKMKILIISLLLISLANDSNCSLNNCEYQTIETYFYLNCIDSNILFNDFNKQYNSQNLTLQ